MDTETGYYAEKWNDPGYIQGKEKVFQELDAYLKEPPKRILDIGCGYAHISEMFQKKYGSELYLLDGDVDESPKNAFRKAKYGSTEEFVFYVPISRLKQHWDRKGMSYNFVDANRISIPDDVKFDLVYSWISCGFHYPAATYKDLITKHTDENSVIVMDFRRKSLDQQMKDFDIVARLNGDEIQKKYRLHIKFKE